MLILQIIRGIVTVVFGAMGLLAGIHLIDTHHKVWGFLVLSVVTFFCVVNMYEDNN